MRNWSHPVARGAAAEIEERAGDSAFIATERIRTVENDELRAGGRRCRHHLVHGPNEAVQPHACILHVDHDTLDLQRFQHGRYVLAGHAVGGPHRKLGEGVNVLVIVAVLRLMVAAKAVLWRQHGKQARVRHRLEVAMHGVDEVLEGVGKGGGRVREHRHALRTKRREAAVAEEDVAESDHSGRHEA
eukprot:4726036-Prymnesium_polylepis.2